MTEQQHVARELFSIPARFRELFDWVCAISAFDYGDPEPLAELISAGDIPEEFRQAVADVVRGTRVPNRKAAAKLKIPARERMRVAAHIGGVQTVLHALKHEAIYPDEAPGTRGASAISEAMPRLLQEPIEVARDLDEEGRNVITLVCDQFGVSSETVENLMREYRRRIAEWPTV